MRLDADLVAKQAQLMNRAAELARVEQDHQAELEHEERRARLGEVAASALEARRSKVAVAHAERERIAEAIAALDVEQRRRLERRLDEMKAEIAEFDADEERAADEVAALAVAIDLLLRRGPRERAARRAEVVERYNAIAADFGRPNLLAEDARTHVSRAARALVEAVAVLDESDESHAIQLQNYFRTSEWTELLSASSSASRRRLERVLGAASVAPALVARLSAARARAAEAAESATTAREELMRVRAQVSARMASEFVATAEARNRAAQAEKVAADEALRAIEREVGAEGQRSLAARVAAVGRATWDRIRGSFAEARS